MDFRPAGSSVHGISQARILEWVAISFSRASSPPGHRTHVSCMGRWVLYHWTAGEAITYIRNISILYKCMWQAFHMYFFSELFLRLSTVFSLHCQYYSVTGECIYFFFILLPCIISVVFTIAGRTSIFHWYLASVICYYVRNLKNGLRNLEKFNAELGWVMHTFKWVFEKIVSVFIAQLISCLNVLQIQMLFTSAIYNLEVSFCCEWYWV